MNTDRLGKLINGIWNRRNCSAAKINQTARLPISGSTFWRLASGEELWTDRNKAAALQCVALDAGTTTNEILNYLLGRRVPSELYLAELEHCHFHHPLVSASLTPLADQIDRLSQNATEIIYFGRVLPPHVIPDAPRPLGNSRLASALRTPPQNFAAALDKFGELIHENFMFQITEIPNRFLVYLLHSDFNAFIRGRSHLGKFEPRHTIDILGTFAHDAVQERNGILGLIDDLSQSLPSGFLRRLRNTAFMLAIDDRFLVRRDEGSPLFISGTANGDIQENLWLKSHMGFMNSLKEFVPHPLDQKTSFDILSAYLPGSADVEETASCYSPKHRPPKKLNAIVGRFGV